MQGVRPTPPRKESPALRRAQEAEPELRGWVAPHRSADAERGSLVFQAEGRLEGEEPDAAEAAKLLEEFVSLYPTTGKLSPESLVRKGWAKRVEEACESLDPKSSPGYPLMRLAKTNGDLLKVAKATVVALAVERLERLEKADYGEMLGLTAEQLVERGFCDPVRVFVKNELHSELKVAQGRMRLIMSISVVDQLVERVLNSAQNQSEIRVWEDIPSKPGLGLHDEGLASLEAQIKKLGRPQSSDITGFDWCVSQWWLDFDAVARERLSGDVSGMHLKRACCLGLSVIVFSDGVMWAQTTRGVQKSGSYNTSSTNSRIRAACAFIVGWRNGIDPAVIAMGDDAVERAGVGDPVSAYARLGFKLKELSTAAIEFCAYRFDLVGGFFPVRWQKMLATMLAREPRDVAHAAELRAALAYELRHSGMVERALGIVSASDWGSGK